MNRIAKLSRLRQQLLITIGLVGLFGLVGSAVAADPLLTVVKIDGNGNPTNSGLVSSPDGINCGLNCSKTYSLGVSVTLTAAMTSVSEFFRGWSNPGLVNPLTKILTIQMDNDRNMNAWFERHTDKVIYLKNTGDITNAIWAPAELVLQTDGAGNNYGWIIPQKPPAFFDENGDGYADLFIPNGAGLTLYRRHPANLPTLYLLTVNNVGDNGGSGRVTSAPAGIDCGFDCWQWYPSSQIVLTAAPDTGSVFIGWSGTDAGLCAGQATPTCPVQMNAHKTITATFSRDPVPDSTTYILDVEVNGNGSGAVTGPGINCYSGNVLDCSESYPADTIVPLKANSALGSVFTGWSGPDAGPCDGSTDPSCDVVMDTRKTVTATFNKNNDTVIGDGSTCPVPPGDDNGGWQAPRYSPTNCVAGNSEFDPGCYPPIQESDLPQSKAGCLSVGDPAVNNDIDLIVDAGAYIRGFLKLPLALSTGEGGVLKEKIGNVLTLTDTAGATSWNLPGLACEINSANGTTGSDAQPWDWGTATSACTPGFTVVDGWIEMALTTPPSEEAYTYAYSESYPAPSGQAWVGRWRGGGEWEATISARCCR